MAEKKIRTEMYVVRSTFIHHDRLGRQIFRAGQTVVAGHPILKGREKLFRPFAPTHALGARQPEPETETEVAPEPESEAVVEPEAAE